MSKDEMKELIAEYTIIVLEGEGESFGEFYELEDFSIKGEENGDVYMVDKGEKTLICNVSFSNAPKILRDPIRCLAKHFDRILEKYDLLPDTVYEGEPVITIESDDNNEPQSI